MLKFFRVCSHLGADDTLSFKNIVLTRCVAYPANLHADSGNAGARAAARVLF